MSPDAARSARRCAASLPCRSGARTSRTRSPHARTMASVPIGRAVGGDDDLERVGRVVLDQRVLELLGDPRLLVVCGDHERHARRDGSLPHRTLPNEADRHQRARIAGVRVERERDEAPERDFIAHGVTPAAGSEAARPNTGTWLSTQSTMARLSRAESHWCVGSVNRRVRHVRAEGKRRPSNAPRSSGISLTGAGYATLNPRPRACDSAWSLAFSRGVATEIGSRRYGCDGPAGSVSGSRRLK